MIYGFESAPISRPLVVLGGTMQFRMKSYVGHFQEMIASSAVGHCTHSWHFIPELTMMSVFYLMAGTYLSCYRILNDSFITFDKISKVQMSSAICHLSVRSECKAGWCFNWNSPAGIIICQFKPHWPFWMEWSWGKSAFRDYYLWANKLGCWHLTSWEFSRFRAGDRNKIEFFFDILLKKASALYMHYVFMIKSRMVCTASRLMCIYVRIYDLIVCTWLCRESKPQREWEVIYFNTQIILEQIFPGPSESPCVSIDIDTQNCSWVNRSICSLTFLVYSYHLEIRLHLIHPWLHLLNSRWSYLSFLSVIILI